MGLQKILSSTRQAVAISVFMGHCLCGRPCIKELGKQNGHGLCPPGMYSCLGEKGVKQGRSFPQFITLCVLRAKKREKGCSEKVAKDVYFGGYQRRLL